MKAAVTFPDGPTEESEAFVVIYRNQFGSLLFAAQNYDDLHTGWEEMLAIMSDPRSDDPIAGMISDD